MKRRVGIFGGTFNPIHVGHLIMAQNALEAFRLQKIVFMPCAAPPHKKSGGLADARHRLAMVRRAIAGNPSFEVSDLEMRRGGEKSYTYDTLLALKKRRYAHDALFFLIGTDMLAQILSWYRIEDVMKLCRFIVLERPGRSARALLARMRPALRKYFGAHVLPSFTIGVSSQEVRRRIARGLSVRYMLTPPVDAYVRRRGLYR